MPEKYKNNTTKKTAPSRKKAADKSPEERVAFNADAAACLRERLDAMTPEELADYKAKRRADNARLYANKTEALKEANNDN